MQAATAKVAEQSTARNRHCCRSKD